MKKSSPHYSPRQGSKIAEAIEALRTRPMTARELAEILHRDCSAINTLLLRALTHAAIIRVKDQRDRLYFALPDTVLDAEFRRVHKDQTNPGYSESEAAIKRNNIHMLGLSNASLPSLNMHPLTAGNSDETSAAEQMERPQAPQSISADSANCAPVVAGLFADGELTISIGGECLQLNTSQRQQLYAYLHKIRYFE